MTARELNNESGGSGNGNGSASETGQTAEGQALQANGHPDHATPNKQGLGANEQVTQDDLKNVVKAVEETPLNVGDKWYLVDHIWWKKFVNASRNGYVEDVPTLSNEKISTLRKDAYYLKMGLNESIDYDALPESAFQFVLKHPGIEDQKRDIIERLVVAKPDGKPYIEIYPRQISFVHSRDQKQSCTVVLSPSDTMETLRDKALTELSLNNHQLDDLRFYIKHLDRVELIDLAKSLDDYFDTAQEVVVDSIENGKWFYASPSASQSSGSLFGSSNQGGFLSTSPFNGLGGSNRGVAYTKGACGLQNLGNTCFMASALQCLSNVPPLTEYFLSDDYLPDINATNPLGAQGELAKAYGELMKQMWSGEHSSVVPRRMKSIIGQFAPRFNGYQQQDAQELMAFLLDGLHEDLNRVRVKPYSEEDENMDKLPESEQAARAWAAYKARNDSIVVDKVHGQLKSTLICPVCSKVSIKFDPFCYLSVPLPPKETSLKQRIIVTFPQQPKRRWAKFMITMTRSTVVDEIQSLILDSFKKSLPQEDEPHLIFFAVPLQGDDIRVLTADALISSVNPDIGSREVFAAAVKFDPEQATTLIIKNQSTLARSLSLPLIFTVEDPATITRKFLLEHAMKATETMFLDKKKQQQQASGQTVGQTQQTGQQQSTDTPMDVDQNGEDGKANEENAEFEIKLKACHENGVTSELIPFHDEVIQQEIKKGQTASGGQTHAVAKTINIIFQWKDKQKFNAYRGNDLIERELSLPIRKDISLTECIDLFTRKEQLGEDDSWYCPQCKKHERATKKLDLWRLPEVLIVHLKRFQYSRFSRDKIDMNVSIPVMNFDLNDKVMNSGHEPVTYNLIAISNHMGGLGGGHYTATALNQTTGKWYDFNDSTATKTTTPDDPLVDRLPYILVYRRQSNSSPSPLSTATDLNIDMETEEFQLSLAIFLLLTSSIYFALRFFIPIWQFSTLICDILPACQATRKALQERQAVLFGIGLSHSSAQSSLLLHFNRLLSSLNDKLNRFSLLITKANMNWSMKERGSLMSNFYTRGLRDLLDSPTDSEKDSNVLIDLLVLQRSEAARLFILCLWHSALLHSTSFIYEEIKKELQEVREIGQLCSTLKGLKQQDRLGRVERNYKIQPTSAKAKLVVSLQEITNGILENRLSDEAVAEKLRRLLSTLTPLPENSQVAEAGEIDIKSNPENKNDEQEKEGRKSRIIADQVFEGFAVVEKEQARNFGDFEEDYFSTCRRPDAAMMSELQRALKGRAEDMKEREKKALAEFYGVNVSVIEGMIREEEKEKETVKNLEQEFTDMREDAAQLTEESTSSAKSVRMGPSASDMRAALASWNLPKQQLLGDSSDSEDGIET